MTTNSSPTLVLVGSGPGIGVATASLFAARKFNGVALIARDSKRILEDRQTILDSLKATGRSVEVKTWSVDIANTKEYEKVLDDVKSFGSISSVIFNAARVAPSKMLEFPEEEIVQDFLVTNIALYITAKWAFPILLQEDDTPSFFVTSSLLWVEPNPAFFSLSLVKSSQRNLVQSLYLTYPSVHVALLNVGGPVSKTNKDLNPDGVAEKYWELYSQQKSDWTLDLNVLGE